MDFANTQTYKNIYLLFNETLQLKYRYEIYSEVASDEGFIEISDHYKKISLQKKEQASVWFSYLESISTTLSSLLLSIRLENNHERLLESYSNKAVEEKCNKIAFKMKLVKELSSNNKADYSEFKRNIENKEVFKKYNIVKWQCIKCGYIFVGYEPCDYCAICNCKKDFFKVK